MAGFVCSEHPSAAASFSCDGCARLLCADCVSEGHRLIFCKLCGERAVALAPAASSVVPERRRQAKIERRYTFAEALAYAFRGSGRLMLPSYVMLMTVAALVPGFGDAIGWFVRLLYPGLLFAIVRTTAEGEVELPEWPDYSDIAERVREGIYMLLIQVTALLPMALFFYLTDSDFLAFVLGETAGVSWAAIAGGLALGCLIGVFAFGAVGTNSSGWLSFRVDLHLRALLSSAGPAGIKTAGLLAALLLASQLVLALFADVLVVSTVVGTAISGYGMFTAAHLVGLVFRKHGKALDAIYRD